MLKFTVGLLLASISSKAQFALLHKIDLLRNIKEEYPSDSRCGSVETCRKASEIMLFGRKNACEMVGAFRVKKLWQA